MNAKQLWYLAKFLEGAGMVLVLVGVMLSISYGLEEEGLKSMRYEAQGLLIGGGMFVVGWALEKRLGAR